MLFSAFVTYNTQLAIASAAEARGLWKLLSTHLRITDPRRLLADVSELTDVHCIASDGGHRVICGVLSSIASYLATWLGISLTSDTMRRLFRLGLFDCSWTHIFTIKPTCIKSYWDTLKMWKICFVKSIHKCSVYTSKYDCSKCRPVACSFNGLFSRKIWVNWH